MFRTGARFARGAPAPPVSTSTNGSRLPVHVWEKSHDPTQKRLRRVLILLSRRPLIVSLTGAFFFLFAIVLLARRSPLAAMTAQTANAIHSQSQDSLPRIGGDSGDAAADASSLAGDRAGQNADSVQSDRLEESSQVTLNANTAYESRVVIVVPSTDIVSVERLSALAASLADAKYNLSKGVSLNFVLVDRKETLSLARVLGRDTSGVSVTTLQNFASSFQWPHGPKFVNVFHNSAEWVSVAAGVPTVLVFADVAAAVSPAYFDSYVWDALGVSSGMDGHSAAVGAPILAASLDSIIPAGDAGAGGSLTGTTARAGVFFPSMSAFVPTPDAWALFLRWRQVRATRDTYESVAAIGGVSLSLVAGKGPLDFPDLDKSPLKGDDVRTSFAEFLYWYGGHVLHPLVGDGLLLVDRNPLTKPSTGDMGPLAGASAPKTSANLNPLRLRSRPKECCALFDGVARWPVSMTQDPTVLTLAGNMSSSGDLRSVPFSSSTGIFRGFSADVVAASAETKESRDADLAHTKAVARIAEYAKLRGGGRIAFTLVTEAFVETTYSWVCNALAVDALPKALVLGAGDASVVRALESLFVNDTRLSQDDALIIDLSDAIHATSASEKPAEGLDFGQSSYWLLMLERTALLRDVLDAGVAVLHFETDQIWFGDPMVEIERCMGTPAGVERGGGIKGETIKDGTPVDMVITINTREEASGNFFYLRPTLATRHLWSLVTTSFQASYRKSLSSREAKLGKWHYIENDQSLFTKFGLGKDPWYQQNFPAATYAVLDRQRFLDGTWYLDFEDEKGGKVSTRSHYVSKESLNPVVLNNNFMIGVGPKKLRAQRFGHWFWDGELQSCNSSIGTGTGRSPLVAAPAL